VGADEHDHDGSGYEQLDRRYFDQWCVDFRIGHDSTD
jgi:hypothetical protein